MEVTLKSIPYSTSLPVTTTTTEIIPVEVHNLLKLSHPSIQNILDYSYRAETKTWTLTLEYSSNWKLLKDVAETRVLLEEEVQFIVGKLLSAILHCFRHGVDHRDITSSSIYIDPDTLDIKLGNFNHSTVLSILPHSLKSPSSSPSSTPPELYRHGSCTPYNTAVWSIGCLLFELLSGSKPLLSSTDVARNNITWEKFYPQSFSPDVFFLVLQCLNPSPMERISFDDLLKHPWIVDVNETMV